MYKIAIIGAGPAGIAMGAELVQSGVPSTEILICEKSEHNSASIRQFYPIGKDINSVYKNIEVPITGVIGFSGLMSLDGYYQMIDKAILDNKLSLTYKTEIQKVIKQDKGFRLESTDGIFEAEYVVLSSGVFSKPRKPDYPIPAALLSKVSYDILALQKQKVEGLDILVVGGGDSASEYVQTLSQMNNHVTLSYRQDKIFRMNQLNIDRLNALSDVVDICLGTNITALEQDGDKIRVKFQEKEDLIVDRIVYSLGGASPVAFMANCGIEYDDTNVVLRDNNETSVDGLFMVGDLVNGRKGGSLMFAFTGARKVMEALHQKYGFPAPKSI
ncbi:MAG: NAD(P)-binding domain-containing protein [Brevinema sp.]